ncbi:hypothetical protein RUA4292_02995 [Ruegeria atlantica]|uniref:Uncharacterized protein n=1 Tax=Ruegeria atlantica TaxID=81569 RepID=A0A0P1E9D4_9RHOB|nr:hypothetical protein RUM4293_04747 [Ruegeria atlantica]CUH48805.1 hypothetical protein RUA4292_02995 [Ruegeria atlantica]
MSPASTMLRRRVVLRKAAFGAQRSISHNGLELAIRCFAAHSDPGNECLADTAVIR